MSGVTYPYIVTSDYTGRCTYCGALGYYVRVTLTKAGHKRAVRLCVGHARKAATRDGRALPDPGLLPMHVPEGRP